MIRLILVVLIGVFAFDRFPLEARAADQPARPNVVIIVADDMGFADVGFNGGKEIATPNIDRLAASGAVLDQWYVQPLCSPTRAALMTGRYPMRYGLQIGVVRPWADYGLPLEERTLAQALKDAGYETAVSGKWHLGHAKPEYLPTRRGFDHQYGHYNGAIDYFTHDRDGGFDWHRNDKVSRDEGYATHLCSDEAVRRIQQRDASKPLFLYVPYLAVHSPHQVPEKYKEPYKNLKEPRRTYAGMLAAMDEGIGKILDALEAAKMRENTLVLFTSDNGGPQPKKVTDNGPLRGGKGSLWEGGVRVAACVAWPGKIPAGGKVTQPLHIVDVYPTVLKLAGAKTEQPAPLDGRDAWATIASGAPSPHEAILLNTTPVNGAIRMGDWKLIVGNRAVGVGDEDGAAPGEAPGAVPGAAPGAAPTTGSRRRARKQPGGQDANPDAALFNLAEDPGETTDLAAKHPEKVEALRAAYDRLAAQAVAPKSKPLPSDFKAPAVWGEQ